VKYKQKCIFNHKKIKNLKAKMNNDSRYEDSHAQNYDTGRNINDTY